jgi:hypothetical protein
MSSRRTRGRTPPLARWGPPKGHGVAQRSAASFHVSPTYVLQKPMDNFIVGHDLVSDILGGRWGKAEVHRLGNENSEDALTWNIFRSLQEADSLRLVVDKLIGQSTAKEPELFLWGRQIKMNDSTPWEELRAVRDEIEPGLRQQTEPDIGLHVLGWGWILIEAKFGSATTTYRGREERLEGWFERYEPWCGGILDLTTIRAAKAASFPEQLLRNALFSARLASGENAMLVALSRSPRSSVVNDVIGEALGANDSVRFEMLAWDDIYNLLPHGSQFVSLRTFFENKSLSLRPAFDLASADYVCPQPSVWHEIHKALVAARESEHASSIPPPPVPLILAAWAHTSDEDKAKRWLATLAWARRYGFQDEIRSLTQEDLYGSDS